MTGCVNIGKTVRDLDTKGVIRIRKSKDRQHYGQKRTKGQTTIKKTIQIKLKIA